jgi:hypothetical protein
MARYGQLLTDRPVEKIQPLLPKRLKRPKDRLRRFPMPAAFLLCSAKPRTT